MTKPAGSTITPSVRLALAAVALTGFAGSGVGKDYMPLGKRTPPPPGFLGFCTRHPVDCDLKVQGHVQGGPGETEGELSRILMRRYLWAVKFPTSAESPAAAHPGSKNAAAHSKITVEEIRSPPEVLPLTDQTMDELNDVNRRVNSLITYKTDLALHGDADHWAYSVVKGGRQYGDCEDYAMQKRRELIGKHVPKSALTIAAAVTREGEPHAVLVVTTSKGDLVMDNLSSKVSIWRDTRLKWTSRQTPGEPMIWRNVGG